MNSQYQFKNNFEYQFKIPCGSILNSRFTRAVMRAFMTLYPNRIKKKNILVLNKKQVFASTCLLKAEIGILTDMIHVTLSEVLTTYY